MAADGKSNTQILRELEALSSSLFQPRSRTGNRRTASFALPRNEVPPVSPAADKDETARDPKPRPRRASLSMSSWPYRPNKENEQSKASSQQESAEDRSASSGKKGIWKWKPIRALTHLGMQKLSCLFSVEVDQVKGLPESMDGHRLAVCVRKKESKDGLVQTMPSRVSQGAADFEETLFIRCHVYFTPGSGIHMRFEPRPFQIYVVAVDAEELDFGKCLVDLSGLIQESIERSFGGTRIRQWDRTFGLSGKAEGGELVLKLGFQIMEKDGGISIYNQTEDQKLGKSRSYSTPFARKQSKFSFSIPSARTLGQAEDGLDLQPKETEGKMDEDGDLPEFEVVDRGVEIEGKNGEAKEEEERSDEHSVVVSGEVVKEVVQDQSHVARLKELDSIAQQIKALELVIKDEKEFKTDDETGSQVLDADEDKVTREFLQMLDDPQDEKALKISSDDKVNKQKLGNDKDEEEVYVPDLGKGLGCVVQTRNGGYLAAANPFGTPVLRKDEPKLAIQMSKPLVIQANKAGFELLHKMAAVGFEELTSELLTLMPIDELMGKTAEQIAFEGIASVIIQGRKKEGATSSAARTIAAVKSMANAMNGGRKEHVSTGIWNVNEDPMTVDEILAFSMHKMETMAIDALKIQADIAEEAAPYEVSPLDAKINAANGKVYSHPLASAIPIEDWMNAKCSDNGFDSEGITICAVIQLRDPLRQYEPVGGHMIVLINATGVANKSEKKRYKVASMQVGGVKVRTLRAKNVWDGEKQKLTALQWLVVYGTGKAGKKVKILVPGQADLLWSISSRVMADMWLKPVRNPDVKFTK